ncbi:MAG: site-specific DNA-methyltransferase [Chloroflexi bacterium]|nr:site-specific DNA-methyltransferase [Chloroflexota bacterium]
MPKLTARHVANVLKQVQGSRKRAQHLDSASIHPFPARMPAALAEFLIEQLTDPGHTILDPMAGSGTTLVAARRLGRRAIGFDLDPLSVTLSRTVTATHHPQALAEANDRVFQAAMEMAARPSDLLDNLRAHFDEGDRTFLDYWFPPRSQLELFALRTAIETEGDERTRNFLWLVFSSLIIAKSAGASYALDLAHSRPHRDTKKRIVWPLEAWAPRFQRAARGLPFASSQESLPEAIVRVGDARHLELEDESVDFVLTSPPYRLAIDYMRAHKFALIWMGHKLDALSAVRSSMIGAERALRSPDGVPTSVEDALKRSIPLPSYRGVIRRYVSDLQASLREIQRVLKPGGVAVVVVGPSIISRSRHDAPELMRQLAPAADLELLATVERRLNTGRRSLPAPSRVSVGNALRKRMRREFLVALGKD